MKKKWLATVFILVVMLLSGCGEMTLEEKVAKVQSANTIKVQDVIDLMELEGLEVTTLTTDAEFKKNWQDAVLVKVNDAYYMALKSFEENLWDRKTVKNDMGWYAGLSVGPEDENAAVHYIAHTYMGHKEDAWVPSSELCGKNIVALVLPLYPVNISELTLDEQYALIDKTKEVSDVLKRVFYNDINGMITQEIAAESDNFKVMGTLHYYATGVLDEHAKKEHTYYDARTWIDGEIVCSDTIVEKYQGMEYMVWAEEPDGWVNGNGKIGQGGVLEAADLNIEFPSSNTADVMWKAPEALPVYVLTITIGDCTETLRLEPVGQNE